MTRTTFFSSGIATVAVASALTLAGPAGAANAAPEGCNPGSPEVTETIDHPGTSTVVPAQTHAEWLWQRTVVSYENEYTREVSAARTEVDWSRENVAPAVLEWKRTVIDQPYVPAVAEVPERGHYETRVVTSAIPDDEAEYLHQVTEKTRWEDLDWGAQNGQGEGWLPTGQTRGGSPEVTEQRYVVDEPAVPGVPAVPEVSRQETAWSVARPSGDGWTETGESRPGATSTETATTAGPAPAGNGWVQGAVRNFEATFDTLWAAAAPAGYSPTGAERVASTDVETTPTTSASAPGSEWTKVDGSDVAIVDVPASTTVTPGWTEEVVVQAAVAPSGTCVVGFTEDDRPGSQAAPAATSTTVLPNTGNPASPLLALTGFATVLAGSVLVAAGRRRRTE